MYSFFQPFSCRMGRYHCCFWSYTFNCTFDSLLAKANWNIFSALAMVEVIWGKDWLLNNKLIASFPFDYTLKSKPFSIYMYSCISNRWSTLLLGRSGIWQLEYLWHIIQISHVLGYHICPTIQLKKCHQLNITVVSNNTFNSLLLL